MQNPGSSSTATLLPGTRLGRYEITSFVAAGGMGEVYRAKDPSLNRDIAIKVLPAGVAADAERRARLEREAQMAAALNHPGIVTIHSVEHDGGRVFITMELVKGRPLAGLIPHNGLSIDRLLAIAVPLTAAVSAAHDHGITHRDLKPANVMVGDDGAVKVLDFGIAKRHDLDAAAATAATATLATAEGRLLGTIAYMSPEQAEGKAADKRSDVFALGTMLYEMATGRRPFSADTDVATLAAIVRDAPVPIAEVNPRVPKELSRIIRRAMAKDPDRRQQSAKDLRNELDELRRELQSGELAPVPTPKPRPASVWVIGAAGVVAALGVAAFWPRSDAPSDSPPGAADLSGLTVTSVTSEDGQESFPSLSPDGKWVVYTADERGTGQTDILLRAVGGLTAINLTGDSLSDDSQPVFSPDGERIAFRSERDGGGLFVMQRTGESVRRMTSDGFNPSWSPDGQALVYAEDSVVASPGARGPSRLWVATVPSGERRSLTELDGVQPSWSPHGHRVAYWALERDSHQRDIWTIGAQGGEPTRVTDDPATDWNPVWSPDGRHLYFSSDRSGAFGLWRVRIDEDTGRVTGAPEPVTVLGDGLAHMSFSSDGRSMVLSSMTFVSNIEVLDFDAVRGKVTGRRQLTWRSGSVSPSNGAPQVSPNGESLAFVRDRDLWIQKMDGTGLVQITNDYARDVRPRWSPDGKTVLFDSERSGRFQIWSVNADGSGLRQVFEHPGVVQSPVWSPDGGRAVAFRNVVPELLTFDPRAPISQQPAQLPVPSDGFMPFSWSRDGASIAGQVPRPDGGIVVYSVQPGTYTRLTEIGRSPAWLPDNRTLLYSTGRELRSVNTVSKEDTVVYAALPRESLGDAVLSPDAHRLFVVISKSQGDLKMASLPAGRTF